MDGGVVLLFVCSFVRPSFCLFRPRAAALRLFNVPFGSGWKNGFFIRLGGIGGEKKANRTKK